MCLGKAYFRYRILACYRDIVISYVVEINANSYGVMCRKQVLSVYFVADHIPALRCIGWTCVDYLNNFRIFFSVSYSIHVSFHTEISPVMKSELLNRNVSQFLVLCTCIALYFQPQKFQFLICKYNFQNYGTLHEDASSCTKLLDIKKLFLFQTLHSCSLCNWPLGCWVSKQINKNWIVGFEVLTVVIMKTAIFWDIAPCSPYTNRRFGGTYHLHLQSRKSAEEETSDSRWPLKLWSLYNCYPDWRLILPSHPLSYFLVRLIFDPEDGGVTFLRNVCSYTDYIPEDGNFKKWIELFKLYKLPFLYFVGLFYLLFFARSRC
jgi:hypothetical protein